VKAITEELCGHSFSASAISAMNQRLDTALAQFAGRPLAEAFPYLILDARCERVFDLRGDRIDLLIEHLQAGRSANGEIGAVHLALVHSCGGHRSTTSAFLVTTYTALT
jgi:putative transposase